jgi:hypothetical protein
MRDRLKELLRTIIGYPQYTCPRFNTDESCDGCKYDLPNCSCDVEGRIADHLLSSGIIVLPCKVGGKIYFAGLDSGECLVGVLASYCLDAAHLWFNCKYDCGLNYWHLIEDFGTKVFRTREEAENALAKMKGGVE